MTAARANGVSVPVDEDSVTTEALISEIKEKEKSPAGMPGGGGMGGMY